MFVAPFLVPDQPLYWLLALYLVISGCYITGLIRRRNRQDIVPAIGFFLGLLGIYLVTQTQLDYLSRYVFFVHRIQHLVLHHLSPFLIALSAPSAILSAGLPGSLRRAVARWARWPGIRHGYRFIQNPLVGGLLFVGLIAFWLWPPVHFQAMLSARDYWLMNLSMLIDGLLFWWFMLDSRKPGSHATTYSIGLRVGVLWAVMVPQIAIGAWIALADHDLYTAYAVCGRAFPIAALTDQQLGGLFTWIPAAMMSVIGTLVLLRLGFRHESRPSQPPLS